MNCCALASNAILLTLVTVNNIILYFGGVFSATDSNQDQMVGQMMR